MKQQSSCKKKKISLSNLHLEQRKDEKNELIFYFYHLFNLVFFNMIYFLFHITNV